MSTLRRNLAVVTAFVAAWSLLLTMEFYFNLSSSFLRLAQVLSLCALFPACIWASARAFPSIQAKPLRYFVTASTGIVVFSSFVFVGLTIAWYLSTSKYHSSDYRDRHQVAFLVYAVEYYQTKYGRNPTTDEGFPELVRTEMLNGVPFDRWGRPYHYKYPSARKEVPFELWTYGEDGVEGGSGSNRDIGNWDKDLPRLSM